MSSEAVYRDEFRRRVLAGKPRSVLEAGCGDGAFLRTVKGEISRLAGLDPDSANAALVRGEGFEAVTGVAEELPFADGEFDVVVFSYTPHHVRDWQKALLEALRVARHSVEVLDVWYDDSIADQRTAHAFDRWLKEIDRRRGMVHNDTLPPGEMLGPALARADLAYDYVCRRIATPYDIAEVLDTGRERLASVNGDEALARAFDAIAASCRRDGISEEGALMATIEKRG